MAVERIYYERIKDLEEENKQLKKMISEIANYALIWDGRESKYYGSTLMNIIYPWLYHGDKK